MAKKKAAKNGAIVRYEGYAIAKQKAEQTALVLRENIGPRGLSEFDLDRIRIPTGGSQAWELPSLDTEPEAAKRFEGIVIHFRDARRYYETPFAETGGGAPPDCLSDDGITGRGSPGGNCEVCPHAQWGSDARGGRAQACQSTRLLFTIRPGEIMPCVVSLPPTSLRNVRRYFLRLGSKGIPFYGVITRFALAKTKNQAGLEYSAIDLSVALKLDAKQLANISAFRKKLLPSLSAIRAGNKDFNESEEATENE